MELQLNIQVEALQHILSVLPPPEQFDEGEILEFPFFVDVGALNFKFRAKHLGRNMGWVLDSIEQINDV